MTSPRQTEPNANFALGNLLKGMMPTSTPARSLQSVTRVRKAGGLALTASIKH